MKIQTDEEFARQMADIMRRFSDGEQLQSWSKNNQGTAYSKWTDCNKPLWAFDVYNYRIKPELKTVPLCIEDMIPGMYFKPKVLGTTIYIGACFSIDGIVINQVRYPYTELAKNWLWSTDFKTWNPCSKIVE